jgi:predicted NUDIX family NTP pyrophosphohydrolase
MKNGKKVLEFVAIKRKDCGAWAIPGGKYITNDRNCTFQY